MQRKARNSFLLGIILTLLITGVIIVFLFLQLKKLNDEIAAEQAKLVNVYTINQDVKSGQVLTEDMFTTKKVSKDTIPSNATSMADVVSAWYLQTKDGKAIGRDSLGLYIAESDSLVELYEESGKYYRISDDEEETVTGGTPVSQDVDGETIYFKTTDNDDVTRVYEDLNTGNCYIFKVENRALVKTYLEFNTVPILAKVNLKANTVITPDYIVQSDAVVTDDVRRQEYNMVSLPIDLTTDDYIDIRLMTPGGQDFIVISKKQVEIPTNADGTLIPDTIWIELNEGEILTMSSAIVEAYGIQGAKLYATKYVEPGMQNMSIPTYYPNNAVIAQINSDPNMLENARQGLVQRYQQSNAAQIRQDYIQKDIDEDQAYDNNVTSGMDAGINNTDTTRRKYIESLGY